MNDETMTRLMEAMGNLRRELDARFIETRVVMRDGSDWAVRIDAPRCGDAA